MIDIVYILKEGKENEELKYSLRSLENKMFNYDRVVFVGGKPDKIEPDLYIPMKQECHSKWDNARNNIYNLCTHTELSNNILLMNDDFFVMRKTDAEKIINRYWGTLKQHIERIEQKNRGDSKYTRKLEHSLLYFKKHGIDEPLNFETHTPFVFERDKMWLLMEKKMNIILRTGYGMFWDCDKIEEKDYKFSKKDFNYNGSERFISSSDYSFREGEIGEYIRKTFNKPSRFERY